MVTILGLGFTGARVARRLLARGVPVAAAVRDPARFGELAARGLQLARWSLEEGAPALPFGKGSRVLHSIPPLPASETGALHGAIQALEPGRIVYLSSTGVYGGQQAVDENSPATPADSRGEARLEEETWLRSGPWSWLILRAAAIYGPGRGVHTAYREGRAPRGRGSAVVSRIHVDDLAALADAALFSELGGAWPVADELPCSSAEILEWCAGTPESSGGVGPSREFTVAGRRVNGAAIRARLGVKLTYPSWKTGVPACLAEERGD